MKTYTLQKKHASLMILLFIPTIWGCNVFSPTISSYDQYAYTQTTSLKVDALNLMDSAIYSYQSEIKSVAAVKLNIQKLYEYDKNRPDNKITLTQWQILTDTNGHLLGGFLVLWRNEKTLKKPFINDLKKVVDSTFDQIAKLESKKIKTTTK